tara:strand:- start:359 stop:751 length:393 start_codon:yes stop_codon:yes gene_type:complete
MIIDKDKNNKILNEMLALIGISFENLDDLIGIKIERDLLLTEEVINHFQKYKKTLLDIGYKTGVLNGLHKNNTVKQRWPALNMIRQILKCNQLKLSPFVKSNGYNKKTGKKNTIRYFMIIKLDNALFIDE